MRRGYSGETVAAAQIMKSTLGSRVERGALCAYGGPPAARVGHLERCKCSAPAPQLWFASPELLVQIGRGSPGHEIDTRKNSAPPPARIEPRPPACRVGHLERCCKIGVLSISVATVMRAPVLLVRSDRGSPGYEIDIQTERPERLWCPSRRPLKAVQTTCTCG